MIIFNVVGLGMLALCFGVAYVAGLMIGTTAEDPVMIIAGPLIFVCDLLYRRRHGRADDWWNSPRYGGQLFFIPVWVFGVLWMVIATFRLFSGTP